MKHIKELISYGFWGVLSTGINLLLMYIFIKLGMQYIIANIVSYVIAVIFSYIFNKNFVFKNQQSADDSVNAAAKDNKDEIVRQIKYFGMRGISIAVDSGLLAFLHEICGLTIFWSKFFDSILIIAGTFLLSKFWIFRAKKA